MGVDYAFTEAIASDTVAFNVTGFAASVADSVASMQGNFSFERTVGANGAAIIHAGIAGGNFYLGDSANPLIALNDVNGAFVMSDAGIATSLTVSPVFNMLPDGVTIGAGATYLLELNTGVDPVAESIQVGAEPLTLDLY